MAVDLSKRIRLLSIFHDSSRASGGLVGLRAVWETNHDKFLKTSYEGAKWLLITSRRHLCCGQLLI